MLVCQWACVRNMSTKVEMQEAKANGTHRSVFPQFVLFTSLFSRPNLGPQCCLCLISTLMCFSFSGC